MIRAGKLSIEDYVGGVLAGDRALLARAITLIESNSPAHQEMAQEVLRKLQLQTSVESVRVGITGPPGVGKSTFIESFGCHLCREGRRVAVLAIDPSSSLSRGSILGDKTRMERLSQEPNCYIRPSPSGGTLGGVARKSRETIAICEAFGFDTILVETVGVGQSETTVRSMVDFFLVLLLTGAGDELQGIKKGIIELADALLITKADGENAIRAEAMRIEMMRLLHFLTPATPGWHPQAMSCSAVHEKGIDAVWQNISSYGEITKNNGFFKARRRQQSVEWLRSMVHEHLEETFYRDPAVSGAVKEIERQVADGTLPVTTGVKQLFEKWSAR
ncbi:MAG: methylmalonyl Co-A mutase-associated GTPase MeaB [Verrucomicrobiota bacterium]